MTLFFRCARTNTSFTWRYVIFHVVFMLDENSCWKNDGSHGSSRVIFVAGLKIQSGFPPNRSLFSFARNPRVVSR